MAEPFVYHRPGSVEEALQLLSEPGAAVLAGGTDVVPLRAGGAIAPASLVDVKGLEELRGVSEDADGGLAIGAATTMRELAADPAAGLAAVRDGAAIVGAEQTRARATIGGNLCRASPAGDTLCGLLVLDAVARLRSLGGEREVPVAEFFAGPGRSVREPDELLVSIHLPSVAPGSAYERFTYRRSMDLAVVGVAARVVIEDGPCRAAAVAIGAVAPTPLLVPEAAAALLDGDCDEAAVEAAVEAVLAAAAPIDDVRGTRTHRLRVLRPLARRVIGEAITRAGAR